MPKEDMLHNQRQAKDFMSWILCMKVECLPSPREILTFCRGAPQEASIKTSKRL